MDISLHTIDREVLAPEKREEEKMTEKERKGRLGREKRERASAREITTTSGKRTCVQEPRAIHQP